MELTQYLVCGVVVVVGLKLLQDWMQGPRCTSKKRLEGKVVVITGGSSGIGKECAKDFCRRGAKVIMLCRSIERGEKAAREISPMVSVHQLELSSQKSVRACAEQLYKCLERIDILVNNAGIMETNLTRSDEGYEMHLATNHLGHFLLTNLLLPLLQKAGPEARVVIVSSMVHEQGKINFGDLNYMRTPCWSPMQLYAQSKLANILFSRELADRFPDIHVYCLHPGVIGSEMPRKMCFHYGRIVLLLCDWFFMPFIKTVESGAQTSLYCSLEESIANHSGRYYSDCSEAKLSVAAMNKEDAKKLWTISERLTRLT